MNNVDPLDLSRLSPEQVIVALAYQLKNVCENLERIDGQLTELHGERQRAADRSDKVMDQFEKRMRSQEDWRTGVKAQMVLGGTLVGVVMAAIEHFWK